MPAKVKENRTKKLNVRLTTTEFEQVSGAARSQGYTESDYVRKHLFRGPSRRPRLPMSDQQAYDYQRALMIKNSIEQIRLAGMSEHIESFLLQIETEVDQLQDRTYLMKEGGE